MSKIQRCFYLSGQRSPLGSAGWLYHLETSGHEMASTCTHDGEVTPTAAFLTFDWMLKQHRVDTRASDW